MEYILLGITFLPTYFLLSISPGLNMLTAMNVASVIGLTRAVSFMVGASIAVGVIAILSIFGVITIMTEAPEVFNYMKYVGAAFLCYIGIGFWRNKGEIGSGSAISEIKYSQLKPLSKGLLTALLNPKGWLFFAAFLPTFLNSGLNISIQVVVIVSIVMVVEFFCMTTYAFGGRLIRTFLKTQRQILVLNRINTLVMFVLAIVLMRY